MSEKIDVLQARVKEDTEPVHVHNDMPDIKINYIRLELIV